jgi:hypothetical protein
VSSRNAQKIRETNSSQSFIISFLALPNWIHLCLPATVGIGIIQIPLPPKGPFKLANIRKWHKIVSLFLFANLVVFPIGFALPIHPPHTLPNKFITEEFPQPKSDGPVHLPTSPLLLGHLA